MEPFKSFDQTFKLTTFIMSVGLTYPNPKTEKIRFLGLCFSFLTSIPLFYCMCMDVIMYFLQGNILELLKVWGFCGPFFGVYLKMVYSFMKRVHLKAIIDRINEDHAYFNTLPEDYWPLITNGITNTLLYSNSWTLIVAAIYVIYIGATASAMTYTHLFTSNPKRFMLFDINRPNREPEARFESPFFELMYSYECYMGLVGLITFTGFDGCMIAGINHACLRVNISCKYIEDAMKARGTELHQKLAAAIKDQCAIFRYIEFIDETFNFYLGMMYLTCMQQLCVCLFIISEGYVMDFKFMASMVGCLLIFVPCKISDKLKSLCEDSATAIYCSGWEQVPDLRVRSIILFMIARAQQTIAIKALGMFTYEMDLFAKTVKSGYSMYTLLKSRQ